MKLGIVYITLMALVFAACRTQRNTDYRAFPRRSAWVLTDKGRAIKFNGKSVGINFDGDRVYGYSGCNNFTGTYVLGGGQAIRFNPLASTKMMCMDNKANFTERDFYSKLAQVNRFEIRKGNLYLYAQGRLLLRFKR